MIDVAELLGCTRCELSRTRQRVVIGSGPHAAPLMVVGEAPGRHEDEGGEPFIGRSGQLFFRLLKEVVGLERGDCFVTNVVKCRPVNNRTPTQVEIATCRPWLDAQLVDVAPRTIVTLGMTASRAVLGLREPMGQLHGRVVDVGDLRAVATYHPAAALRGGSRVLELMRDDLATVRQLVESS
ncbi:MAG: uracil-DNA glycosylase [Acidimicrobiales bacterium]